MRKAALGQGESSSKHRAFLDTLLDATDEDGKPLDDDVIRQEVDTFMFEVC